MAILSLVDDSWKTKVWFGKTADETRVFSPSGDEIRGVESVSVTHDADGATLHLTVMEPVILSEEPPKPVQEGISNQLQLDLEPEGVQKSRLQQAMELYRQKHEKDQAVSVGG